MKRFKHFLQIFLFIVFLTSCKTSINKDYPIINPEDNINDTKG